VAATGQGAPDEAIAALRDMSAGSIDFEPALGIPWQSGLDPLTGLADRRWFLRAVAVSDGSDGGVDSHADDVGIIAVRINGLRSLRVSHGQVAADGVLLLVAEVLHGWSRGDDLAARLGVDSFGVLAHTDAAGLAATAARLRTKLADAGVSATIGSAMRAAQGGASEALRTANRDVGKGNGTRRADEGAASRAIRGASAGTAAQVIQAQATGILMQWHRCGADRARLELAYQAHEMGIPVTSMARLLIAVASGEPLSDQDAAYGIDLERSTRLAANVTAGMPRGTRAGHGDHIAAGDDDAYTPSRQMQPVWSVRPPNTASGLLSLAGPDASSRAEDLLLAGRYRGAASPSGSGGDWFDAFILPDGTAALVLGDVAGHDALAATTMMQLRTLLRSFAVTHEIAPSEVLRRLDVFFAHLDLDLLATAFFGWVHPDPAGGLVLRWCNAGHLPPLVVGADGETVVLETRNDLLLGLGLETKRADLSLRLEAGSTLLLYSDGLIETRKADLDHGVERLRAAARAVAMLDVAELCDELVSAMVGVSARDDVTVLAVRIPLS
jgi:GGDEF domain-containing protein